MPTKKPRISVLLPDDDYEVVSRLARLQGQSKAAFVAGLVTAIREPLTRTVALLEAARAAPARTHAELRKAALQSEMDLIRALDQGQDGLRRLLEIAREEGSTPVPVTRGSGGLGRPPTRHPRCPTCGSETCPGSFGFPCRKEG